MVFVLVCCFGCLVGFDRDFWVGFWFGNVLNVLLLFCCLLGMFLFGGFVDECW